MATYEVTEETVINNIPDEKIEEALDIEYQSNDWGEPATLREYLHRLAFKVVEEEESFNGKRPFGNGGWIGSMAPPLIKAGLIVGTYSEPDEEDRWGNCDGYDQYEIVEVIEVILNYLFRKDELPDIPLLEAALKNANYAFMEAVAVSYAAQKGDDEDAKAEAVARVHAASVVLMEAKVALDKAKAE